MYSLIHALVLYTNLPTGLSRKTHRIWQWRTKYVPYIMSRINMHCVSYICTCARRLLRARALYCMRVCVMRVLYMRYGAVGQSTYKVVPKNTSDMAMGDQIRELWEL